MCTICYSDHGAGLNDRISIIYSMALWSIALNCKLKIDFPCNMLHPKHNSHRRISCDIPWSNYISVTYNNNPFEIASTSECSLNVTDFYSRSKNLGNYVKVSKKLKKVKISMSKEIVTKSNFILKKLKLHNYETIHIRRTDTVKICNTDLLVMLKRIPKIKFITNTVLFFTDEKNEHYIRSIVNALKQRNLKVFVLDKIITNKFNISDNFMIYGMENVIASKSLKKYEWRKMWSCPTYGIN